MIGNGPFSRTQLRVCLHVTTNILTSQNAVTVWRHCAMDKVQVTSAVTSSESSAATNSVCSPFSFAVDHNAFYAGSGK